MSALSQLADEGKTLRAGQTLQYVITGYSRRNVKRRAVPVQLINDDTAYDARRYAELLAETCNSITEPFGYTVDAQKCRALDLATMGLTNGRHG
jgi:DNA polymerase elongation subunit (family B)